MLLSFSETVPEQIRSNNSKYDAERFDPRVSVNYRVQSLALEQFHCSFRA